MDQLVKQVDGEAALFWCECYKKETHLNEIFSRSSSWASPHFWEELEQELTQDSTEPVGAHHMSDI